MDNTSEWAEGSLEVLGLNKIEWHLGFSMSISIWLVEQEIIQETWMLEDEKENLFANSLLGATIQDGGIRERSVEQTVN